MSDFKIPPRQLNRKYTEETTVGQESPSHSDKHADDKQTDKEWCKREERVLMMSGAVAPLSGMADLALSWPSFLGTVLGVGPTEEQMENARKRKSERRKNLHQRAENWSRMCNNK
jgi:hypothetical protein